jgi:hypothetical protein
MDEISLKINSNTAMLNKKKSIMKKTLHFFCFSSKLEGKCRRKRYRATGAFLIVFFIDFRLEKILKTKMAAKKISLPQNFKGLFFCLFFDSL